MTILAVMMIMFHLSSFTEAALLCNCNNNSMMKSNTKIFNKSNSLSNAHVKLMDWVKVFEGDYYALMSFKLNIWGMDFIMQFSPGYISVIDINEQLIVTSDHQCIRSDDYETFVAHILSHRYAINLCVLSKH